ncbi:MAG: hypothetical protein U0794_15900 [Isosphaeraceae bacterium]
MIGPDRLLRPDGPLDDQSEELNEGELVLRVIDLPAEQGDLGTIFLGIVEELERIARRAGRAPENSDHEVGIKPVELLDRLGTVVDHLQEDGSTCRRHTRQHAGDHVVDVRRENLRFDGARNVGIEHLEEVAKLLALGFLAKRVEAFERPEVVGEIVVEGDAVKAQVRAERPFLGRTVEMAAHGMVNAHRAERLSGLLCVVGSSREVNIRRVVRAHRGGDVRAIEQPFLHRQRIIGTG